MIEDDENQVLKWNLSIICEKWYTLLKKNLFLVRWIFCCCCCCCNFFFCSIWNHNNKSMTIDWLIHKQQQVVNIMNEEEEKNKKFVNLDFCVYVELNEYTHTHNLVILRINNNNNNHSSKAKHNHHQLVYNNKKKCQWAFHTFSYIKSNRLPKIDKKKKKKFSSQNHSHGYAIRIGSNEKKEPSPLCMCVCARMSTSIVKFFFMIKKKTIQRALNIDFCNQISFFFS